jgi:nucleoside-diphosphate-sugar epimerase
MKIVLTGATGFVGSHVLTRLLDDAAVTGVTALTRRPIGTVNAKLDNVVLDDFTSYDGRLVDELASHDGCIWALGGKDSDLADPAAYQRVTHTFTLSFARLVAARTTAPFTFCYLSGMGADPTETARLPWQRLTRHLKGRTERDLRQLAREHPGFEVHCFRPGGILPADTGPLLRALLSPIAVGVDQLVTALVRVAGHSAAPQPAVMDDAVIDNVAIHNAAIHNAAIHNAAIRRLARAEAGADQPG